MVEKILTNDEKEKLIFKYERLYYSECYGKLFVLDYDDLNEIIPYDITLFDSENNIEFVVDVSFTGEFDKEEKIEIINNFFIEKNYPNITVKSFEIDENTLFINRCGEISWDIQNNFQSHSNSQSYYMIVGNDVTSDNVIEKKIEIVRVKLSEKEVIEQFKERLIEIYPNGYIKTIESFEYLDYDEKENLYWNFITKLENSSNSFLKGKNFKKYQNEPKTQKVVRLSYATDLDEELEYDFEEKIIIALPVEIIDKRVEDFNKKYKMVSMKYEIISISDDISDCIEDLYK